jgi:elongation factor Ts
MANISAADVKRLRDLTGAGMMDCKKALEASEGDLDKAIEFLRIKGQAGLQKREDRTAANGLVAADVHDGVGTLVELNCETDFVAKSAPFADLARVVLDQAVAAGASELQELLASTVAGGKTLQEVVDEAAATIGEKILVSHLARLEAPHVASYLHKTSPDLPPQIGVLVAVDAPSPVARDVAMHVAALPPRYLARESVPEDVVASERRIAEETAREEGKPEQALGRIVEGRLDGFFRANVLLEQKYAKDQSTTVSQVLSEAGVRATGFARFKVGA